MRKFYALYYIDKKNLYFLLYLLQLLIFLVILLYFLTIVLKHINSLWNSHYLLLKYILEIMVVLFLYCTNYINVHSIFLTLELYKQYFLLILLFFHNLYNLNHLLKLLQLMIVLYLLMKFLVLLFFSIFLIIIWY